MAIALLGGSSIQAAATIDDGLGEMAASLGKQISKAKLSRIGVLEFINDTGLEPQLGGNTGSAGRYAASKLEEGLFRNGSGAFEVIERKELEKVIQEVKLQISDLVKTEVLERIYGQISGLDGLVIGTLTRVGGQLWLSAKVIHAQTAVIKAMHSVSAKLTPDLAALFGESVYVPPTLDGKQAGEQEVLSRVNPVDSASKQVHPLDDPISSMPYSVKILVEGRALAPSFKGQDMYVGVSQGVSFVVELENNSDRRVAVALLLDGLSSIGQDRVLPLKARKWVLEPGKQARIRGWQMDRNMAREFIFTGAEKSLALRKGFHEQIGLITACFYPEIEEERIITRSGEPEVAVGEGAEIENEIKEVTLKYEDTPAAIINVRYDLPEAVRDL